MAIIQIKGLKCTNQQFIKQRCENIIEQNTIKGAESMSSRSSSYRHNPHIFSPMQMLYNYANNIKSSISEFFREYLRPEGKETFLIFNRYMLLAIAVNIDIKLLIVMCLVVYMVVKLLIVRLWRKERGISVPLSFVNALYEYRKRKNVRKTQKSSQTEQEQQQSPFLSQKLSSSSYSLRLPILCIQQKQQLLKQLHQPQLGYFTSGQIQHFIYSSFNSLLTTYCQIIWYLKWNAISVLWIIVALIYVIEPSSQYDKLKIKTKKDGAFQIGQVEKASQIVNYFQLIFLCLLVNGVLFYYYGTRRLRNELLLEVYTREYTYNLIKKRRLREIKSSMNTQQRYLTQSDKPLSDQPSSPMIFCTVVDKGKAVDLQELRNFGASSQQKSSPKIQVVPDVFSERKFSHDVPMGSIETPPKKPLEKKQNIQIEELLEQSRVQSEEEIQEQCQADQEQFLMNLKFNGKSSEKPQVLPNSISRINSLMARANTKKSPSLEQKRTFRSANSSQNLLQSKHGKASEQQKTHQVYTDFRISLFKVEQETSIANQCKR